MIPREIRRQAGLEPGMAFDVRCQDGRIEIERAPLDVKVVKKGRFLVAEPGDSVEPLTNEIVAETRRALDNSRA